MSLKALKADILGFLSQKFKVAPQGFEMYFLHKKIHFLHDANEIKEMLLHEKDYYQKSKTYDELGRFLGDSILCTNDWKHWLQNRGTMQSSFTKKAVAQLEEDIEWVLKGYFEGLNLSQSLPFKEHSNAIFADVVIFGILKSQVSETYDPIAFSKDILFLAQFAEYRLKTPIKWPLFIPLKQHRTLKRILKQLQPELKYIIANAEGDTVNALKGLVNEGKLSEKQLFDEILTLIVAGQETTASALAFTLYLLDQNDAYIAQLRFYLEFNRQEEFNQLLDQIIHESLRLFPPAWAVSRKAIKAHQLKNRKINKGNIVFASFYHLHRSNYFHHANDFIPERWNDVIDKNYYMPYGRGKRQCIGNHLAHLELKLGLRYIIENYEFKCTNPEAFKLVTPITLGTAHEMYFKFDPI